MDTTHDAESKLTASMRELSQLVGDFARNGKQANAAGLKPQLQFRSFGVFSESALGFPNFRSFLRAAEARGFIRLRQMVGGDLLALPAETVEEPSNQINSPAPEPKSVRPIRSELWRALFNWRAGLKRLYRVPSGDVYVFPVEPSSLGETALHAAIRAEWHASPNLFLEIEPITQEKQLRWMREFTEQLPSGDAKQALTAALGTARPGAFFTRLAAALPDGPAWKQFRLERVIGEIHEWANLNHLTIDLYGRPTDLTEPPTAPESPSPAVALDRVPTEELRRRILRAIEKMSASDLLRIAIPAEYWYE
jgi:hypothetical protein